MGVAERRGGDGEPGGIVGVLEYASDLFERGSVEALAGRFVRLLEDALGDPERAIGKLAILTPAERHTILAEWNATTRALPSATLPELFAAQVARSPAAVAAIFAATNGSVARSGFSLPYVQLKISLSLIFIVPFRHSPRGVRPTPRSNE